MINETTETLELACYSATLELSLLLACTAKLGSLEQVVSTKQDKRQRCGSVSKGLIISLPAVPTKRKSPVSPVKISYSRIEFPRILSNEWILILAASHMRRWRCKCPTSSLKNCLLFTCALCHSVPLWEEGINEKLVPGEKPVGQSYSLPVLVCLFDLGSCYATQTCPQTSLL